MHKWACQDVSESELLYWFSIIMPPAGLNSSSHDDMLIQQ